MNPRFTSTARLSFPLATAVAAMLAASSASAENLYWDTNGTIAGSGAATGTWGIDVFWSTDVDGLLATANTATIGVDDLFFSAGTTGTGGIVTVDGSQTARRLTFEEGAITLSGGTLITLAGGGGLSVDAGAGDAIVSTALTLNGNNTFNVGTGRTLTLDTGAFTRGTHATLNVQGAGSVTSTKSGLAVGGMVNGIIGPWASFGSGGSTQYATFSGNNIVGLTGTTAATAADVTDTGGTFNYDVAAVGTLGTGASINTLRYTGAAGTIAGGLTTKGIMNAGSGALTFSGAVTSGANTTELVVNTANADITFNGVFTGAINKTGSGTMTLGSAAHSIGAWTVNEGILVLSHSATTDSLPGGTVNSGGTVRLSGGNGRVNNSGIFTINAGGTFDINGVTDLVGGMVGAGSIINSSATNASVHTNPGGATRTFTGVVGGGGGGLLGFILNGNGTQILSGLNTYAGVTDIRNGSLSINSIKSVNGGASAIGAPTTTANGTIAMGNGTSTGTLVYTGAAAETNRVINLNGTAGGATLTQSATSGLLKFTSAFTATGIGSKTLTLNGSTAGTGEIAGAIVNNSTTGTTVSTAASTASTSLVLGSVDGLTVGNAISGTGIPGGTTISAINTSTRTVTLSAAATVASGTAITSAGLVNQTSLTKSGTGTWVLSGNNTYTGATTINGGAVILSEGGRLGGGNYSRAVSIAPGATLTVQQTGGAQTLSGPITGGGGVVLNGLGTGLILSGTGSSYGSLTLTSNVVAGRVFINNTGALPAAATVAIDGGTFVIGAAGTYNSAITAASGVGIAARNAATLTNVTLPGSGSIIFNNDDASTNLLTISSGQTLTGALTVQVGGDKMTGSTAALGAVTLSGDLIGNGSLVVTSSGNPANTALFGKGQLNLSGTNTYTGNTLVNSGTLTLADSGGLSFTIGASGVNNQISGTSSGTVNLDGIFTFDLTSAGTTPGDFWNIVDLANLGTVTFGSNFSVADFTDAGSGLWNRNFGGVDYQFSTTSGALSVIPEPTSAMAGLLLTLGLLRRRRGVAR
jgi:autotransporter-associated beta strand protein